MCVNGMRKHAATMRTNENDFIFTLFSQSSVCKWKQNQKHKCKCASAGGNSCVIIVVVDFYFISNAKTVAINDFCFFILRLILLFSFHVCALPLKFILSVCMRFSLIVLQRLSLAFAPRRRGIKVKREIGSTSPPTSELSRRVVGIGNTLPTVSALV